MINPKTFQFSLLLLATTANAEHYPFDSNAWTIAGADVEVVEHLGRTALRIKGGGAELNDVELLDGVIEYDFAITPDRGFVGAFFRKVDDANFENFYVRPHQSGNPDANQYQPVWNGVAAWQLYHGPGYGAPVEYRYNEWMHVKIVFEGRRADIYIDSETPTIRVRDLKRPPMSGKVGVNASNFAPGHVSNFDVSPLPEDYRFAELAIEPPPPQIVTTWQVSKAFDSKSLEGVTELGEEQRARDDWTTLYGGISGITNLARVQGVAEGSDTAFARLVVDADGRQTKGLRFGYSDAVAVYVNGTLIYSGSNAYRSRDYRYLGTIGLFDQVHLPLSDGENEVWFAVTESFGGWGIQAQFDDLAGIAIK